MGAQQGSTFQFIHFEAQMLTETKPQRAKDTEHHACASCCWLHEVGDLIFVIGFHRNWAVSVGEHTPFEETDRRVLCRSETSRCAVGWLFSPCSDTRDQQEVVLRM